MGESGAVLEEAAVRVLGRMVKMTRCLTGMPFIQTVRAKKRET